MQDPRGVPGERVGVWGNGYLPAAYQGTLFRSAGRRSWIWTCRWARPQEQRQEFDSAEAAQREALAQRPGTSELEARISAYELAFRMQAEAPRWSICRRNRKRRQDVRAG